VISLIKKKRLLILCKTYPSPSAKHVETSCVAGMTETGELIRLYPVPFRLVSDEQQFRKWQWIDARVQDAPDDRRIESHRLHVDSIKLGDVVPSAKQWEQRRRWLAKLPVFDDFDALESARQQANGPTLALLRSARIAGLDIKRVKDPEWTPEEKAKLTQLQAQGSLFQESDPDLRLLRKLPYDFHYRYECDTDAGTKAYRHKIVDWEVGALYWNIHRKHGAAWEAPFRAKIEAELPGSDLMFLMGTIHRFPDQWLIVSLIYPPKQQPGAPAQGSLFAP
jgi:hypothetical protein